MLALLDNRRIEDMHARILAESTLRSRRDKANARRCWSEQRGVDDNVEQHGHTVRSQGETAILESSNVWTSSQPNMGGDITPGRCPEEMLVDFSNSIVCNNSNNLQIERDNAQDTHREPNQNLQHVENYNVNAGHGIQHGQDHGQQGDQVRSDFNPPIVDMFPLGHVPVSVGPRVMPPVHDANVYPLDDTYANANENVRKHAHHGRDERTVRSLADEFSAVQMPGDMPRPRNAAGYQVDYREPQSVNAHLQENA